MSLSSVQRDLANGGVALRRLLGGGSLGSWGAAVYGEEETVVQLLKWVMMPSLIVAPVGVVFLIGGESGGISGSIVSTRNLIFVGGHH
jgi:hypothetical protein